MNQRIEQGPIASNNTVEITNPDDALIRIQELSTSCSFAKQVAKHAARELDDLPTLKGGFERIADDADETKRFYEALANGIEIGSLTLYPDPLCPLRPDETTYIPLCRLITGGNTEFRLDLTRTVKVIDLLTLNGESQKRMNIVQTLQTGETVNFIPKPKPLLSESSLA